jgi:biotin carboxyl carrier protein
VAQGRPFTARVESERDRLRSVARPEARGGSRITARSTLPGVIRRVLVQAGAAVEEGTPIVTLEAMKMENEIRAEAKGRLQVIHVREGQVVNAGDVLAEIELE